MALVGMPADETKAICMGAKKARNTKFMASIRKSLSLPLAWALGNDGLQLRVLPDCTRAGRRNGTRVLYIYHTKDGPEAPSKKPCYCKY